VSTRTTARHADWLSLVDPVGPFLTLPVIRRVWPGGPDRTPARLRVDLRERYEELGTGDDECQEFVGWVLRRLLSFGPAVLEGPAVPEALDVFLAEHGATLRADFAIVSPSEEPTARLLATIWPAGTDLAAHVAGEQWAASPVDRMATHLRHAGVTLGLVTDGDRFCVVYAPRQGAIGRATWVAGVFTEAAEHTQLDAFVSVLGSKRFFAVAPEDQLEALIAESASAQAEVTWQLGRQVRAAVELLVGAFSRANRELGGAALTGLDPHLVYEAACTVMMRLVFLLYAEERRLLPLGEALYDDSYAVSTLRQALRDTADAIGNEESLEHTSSAWPRLLASFRAVHGGLSHDELRLPPYGGRLFDPDRYPFLEGRRPGEGHVEGTRPIPVDDRTVLGILDALQVLKITEGGVTEARRLSFRSLDVEQIGHVYEGLLDHSASRTEGVTLGLIGRPGDEPEVAMAELVAQEAKGQRAFVTWLVEVTKRSEKQIEAALAKPLDDARRAVLRAACDNDDGLLARLQRFAWLLRDDLRGLPLVLLAGSIYVTEVSHRRDTGTEYTPKELAEEVARYALEPLVYSPGPAEGAPPEEWKLKSVAEILALKVCDPAIGSGAIITAACRYLGDRLVEAWAAEGTTPAVAGASPLDDVDDVRIAARRAVAERCLFGVDRDPMATEMAKLSLWLVTMAKERPFSFLDHAFRSGDSLLGITSFDQVARFHIDPYQAVAPLNFAGNLEPLVKEALELRQRLEAVPLITVRDAEEKERLFTQAVQALQSVETIADLVIGAALSTAGQSKRDLDARLASVAGRVSDLLHGDDETRREAHSELSAQADAWLNEGRPDAAPHRRCLHWPLAFPEVFVSRPTSGFDAMVGNPPFLGGKRISGSNGIDYRELLVKWIADGAKGNADLVTYFFLRAADLVCKDGGIGFLATNTIAQGDTREVGLDSLTANGWIISRAVKSRPWPGSATLEIAQVWLRHGNWNGPRTLENASVETITSALEVGGRTLGQPYRLAGIGKRSFIGSFVNGIGFVLDPQEANDLLQRDQRNADVVFPYLNGEDLNSRPDCSPSRWVINFFDWPLERAEEYPDCLQIVRERVKPLRDKVNRQAHRKYWWHYGDKRTEMYAAIAGLDRVLVIAQTSKTLQPVFVTTGQVLSHMLVVFSYDDSAHFGLIASAFHYWWTLRYSATMRTDLRYIPTDCFETFPQPLNNPALEAAGEALDVFRVPLMLRNGWGLTKTYNRVHDPTDDDPDIVQLRELHVLLDLAVSGAYGWGDLQLDHGFHDTPQGTRYTIGPAARTEVLDRLLELNHERHVAELAGAVPANTKRVARKAKATSDSGADVELTLFDPLFSSDSSGDGE
jgi:hypothetical protein